MNTTESSSKEKRFDWPLCHEAENLILARLDAFLARNTFTKRLAERMRDETGTLLVDWVDHLVVAAPEEPAWRKAGFVEDPLGETPAGRKTLWHPEAMLPRVLLDADVAQSPGPAEVALHVESVLSFMAAHRLAGEPEGAPLSRFRRFTVVEEHDARLTVVERRGYRGYVPARRELGQVETILRAAELWRARPRAFADDADGYRHTLALIDQLVELVGRDLACHVVFAGERDYWQRRNRAAQVQHARQQRLGLGWANHDHHTFRSSRRHFVDLMRALDRLGFARRERYYTGAEAGWGAQICEQPVEGIVAFCDVDLEPEETEFDFSRELLPPSKRLGTIGLWVGLHGESFLDAGLHHLECRFDYARLREQLAAAGVPTMKPFSELPFLKQAFTEGERWPVRRERAELLRRDDLITEAQFHQFVNDGAIGSHLENLQRKGGFKGFNQKSVSVIIEATDPRRVG